jgi:hypothetical protein
LWFKSPKFSFLLNDRKPTGIGDDICCIVKKVLKVVICARYGTVSRETPEVLGNSELSAMPDRKIDVL